MYLQTENIHEHDKRIGFDEANHVYSFDKTPVSRSVTQVVSSYFEHFEAPSVVRRMMEGRNWPRPQYTHSNGSPFSEVEILAQWERVGEEARNQGDLMSHIS